MGLEAEMCSREDEGYLPQSKDGHEATRRVYHNVIEKKRKDRLKSAIHDIRKIIPLSVLFNKKATHCDVLEKAGEYIKSLEEENRRLLHSSNEDVRAEIIAKLRKEREDLTREKQRLMEIIEFSSMHSDLNQTVLTTNWKRKSTNFTANNSETFPMTICNQAIFSKASKASSGGTAVEKKSEAEVENLSTVNQSLTNCGASTDQRVVSTNNGSPTTLCENLSLAGGSLVSSCDKSCIVRIGTSADPAHSVSLCNDEDRVTNMVLPVVGTSQPPKAKKPKRTINLYLAERKNLDIPVATMIQSNPLPVTNSNSFLHNNNLVKSWMSCQGLADSSFCNTGTSYHSTPALAVVLGSHHSQANGSSFMRTELASDTHVTALSAPTETISPVLITKATEEVLPSNEIASNQNSLAVNFNSNFENNVNIVESFKESGVQHSSEEAYQYKTQLKEQEFENELINRTESQVKVTYARNKTEAEMSTSNESRIEVVRVTETSDKNSNRSIPACCHCKKYKMAVNKHNNEQQKGLRKCKSSEELRKIYLERDEIDIQNYRQIATAWTHENKASKVFLVRNGSQTIGRQSQENNLDLLKDSQSKQITSSRKSDGQAVEEMNVVDFESYNNMENKRPLDNRNSLSDLRDFDLLSEFTNNCQYNKHCHKDELPHVLDKEQASVLEKEYAGVAGSKHSVLDKNQSVLLQVQLVNNVLSCSPDVSASSGLLMLAAAEEERGTSENIPCSSVVENVSGSAPIFTELTPQSQQSVCVKYSNDAELELCSSSSSLWSGAETWTKKPICHNGCMFVTSDSGQNWMPITTGSLIPNNSLHPLPNAFPVTFQSQILNNASSSVQLIGSLNPFVLTTMNQPLTLFLPSSQLIPIVSQPSFASPAVVVPYHQISCAPVHMSSISSKPRLHTVLSTTVAQNLLGTSVVAANHQSNSDCTTSHLTSAANQNDSGSVLCSWCSSESSLLSDLSVSASSDLTTTAVGCSLSSAEASVVPASQVIAQEVTSLQSSEILLDSGKKTLKRKLSMSCCPESEVVNVCRKPRISSPSEIFENQTLNLEAQKENIEICQLQSPCNSEIAAQSISLSDDLPCLATHDLSRTSSNISSADLPKAISTRNLCSEAIIMTQLSSSNVCSVGSVSNLTEDQEHEGNLLVRELQSAGMIGKTEKCIAGQIVDSKATECRDPLSQLPNQSLESGGNKEPIESFPLVETALMKPSLWPLDFESKGKRQTSKLTADDKMSQFSCLSPGGCVASASEHQECNSLLLHKAPAINGQHASATVIMQESPTCSVSSRTESRQAIALSVQHADLQRNEICGFIEHSDSQDVEKVCGSNSDSDEFSANQLMNHESSKGSAVAHISPRQKDLLNQSVLLGHEHWLPDSSYRNSVLRPYELEPVILDKHIWTPAMDINKMDQLNMSVNTTGQILCQPGVKRPSKTLKSQKKKCMSKVGVDSEVSGRSTGNVPIFNQGNDAMFSISTTLSSHHKEFPFQSFLPPPLPPFPQKSAREGLLEAADKSTNFREVYQSLKSKLPDNSNVLVVPPTEVSEIIAQNNGNIEKQTIESFNEDSSNVLSDALNFADNDDFTQIYLDEMETIMDTHSAPGKLPSQTKSTLAAWHPDLFSSSKRSKLRDKTDIDGNRNMDLDDRFPVHHRQDLFGFSADVFTENDDLNAVGSFNNVLLNRKANMSSTSSWQLPVFSESLNTPDKYSYLAANEPTFNSGSSKNYAGNNLYAATDSSSFHLDSTEVACTRSSRSKNISSGGGGIFCLAQHAVQEKFETSNNQMHGQSYNFSHCLKASPGTCRVESSNRNFEQNVGLRNRNFPDYNLPFYNNEFSMDKSYSNIVSSARCPPESSLWASYSSKDHAKPPTCASTSAAAQSPATLLSFRPQVEVEYSSESHRTKDSMVQITSSLLSSSYGSLDKDCRPLAALSTSIQAMDGLTYTGRSWNDRVREQSFLPNSPWKSSYCASSSLRLSASDTDRVHSPRINFITNTTSSGSKEQPSKSASDRFHFSISLPPNTIHASALSSTTTLPSFSLACLPLEHGSSFSFNLASVPDIASADVATSSHCSQEKRNQFSFYPLEHIEDDLHHVVPSARTASSPPPCSQATVSDFTLGGCELSSRKNNIQRNGVESLQQRVTSSLSSDNQTKPLPSFFNIASYGMKDNIPAPMCSEVFPHSKDLGFSSAMIHDSSAAVTYAMSFSHPSYSNSCSLNAYHPQNFYHHGATFPGSLTSPPLHHPPLAADPRLSSESQSKFDSSFSLHSLQFPPVLNFVPPPPPPPPTFCSPMVRFSSQVPDDPTAVCLGENSKSAVSHLSVNSNSKVPLSVVPHDLHVKQPTSSETRFSKSGSKRSSRSSKRLSSRQTTLNDRNVMENSETVTPYFSLPNFSSGKNSRCGIPTYFPSHPFRGEPRSCTTSSFNPLLTGPRVSLNLHQPSSGFASISTSSAQMSHTTSVPVLPPIHNFGFGNLFSDLNNPTALGGDSMSISPVKFAQGVPPPPPILSPQATFDPSLHQQPIAKMPSMFSNHTTASFPPNVLHSMSINSLLGHQHPRFEDPRTVLSTAAVSSASAGAGGMTMPFELYRP